MLDAADREFRECDRWCFHASVIRGTCANAEWDRLLEWIADGNRKAAELAFSAGPTRQVAYSLEAPLASANRIYGEDVARVLRGYQLDCLGDMEGAGADEFIELAGAIKATHEIAQRLGLADELLKPESEGEQ